MDHPTIDQPKAGDGAASDGEQELIVHCPYCGCDPVLHIKYGEGENIHWHCGTTLHGKELERGAQCRRAPTTDNLEQYGKAVARQPILPEYGTLNPPASPPEVTEEFDGVRWKCLKIVDGDKAIDPYNVRIGGVLTDPYRVARAYGIEDPVIFQALKKLLRCGRKHKAKAADVREAITSLERWEAMNREDAQ